MRTTEGPRRVDVIYRRIDDAYLTRWPFKADSMLGVPGLLSVYRAGGGCWPTPSAPASPTINRSTPSAGDDPLYLGEQPILSNIPTWQCRKAEDLSYVLST